jgi:two-component system cell cycle response regulator DivK
MAGELVLIVEDNELNLKLARDVLRLAGYRTLEARTAAEGLALARAHRPDLVLLDVRLPDTDGVAALGRLRAAPATAAIPVVALTALAMEGDRARFLAAGFDGYLPKPLDVRRFPEQVRQFCERAAQREQPGGPPDRPDQAGQAERPERRE